MKKQIVINEVQEIKSGEGKRGKWHLYKVVSEEGDEFTTFEGKYTEMVGSAVEIEYSEEKVKGKKEGQWFTNRTIVEKAQAPKWTPPVKTLSYEQEIEKKIDKILATLERIEANQNPI